MKIERKIKKRRVLHTGGSQRHECDKELLNKDKRQCFIVGDIDSILIEGTINIKLYLAVMTYNQVHYFRINYLAG